MKVVILCGGMGTRMQEETESKPKPLVTIGQYPILWHIMKTYSHYGFKEFILCLGYKAEKIKDYFLNYECMNSDFTIRLAGVGRDKELTFHNKHDESEWSVTLVDTGLETNTGGRINKIKPYINGDMFLATYGDAVADIDINKLIDFHKESGRIATLTGVHTHSTFGILDVGANNNVLRFKEKPTLDGLINGGFFVFDKKIFRYLDDKCVLEKEPMANLSKGGHLGVYRHTGFWQCMDTVKDARLLEKLWASGKAPWRVWK